MKKSEKPFYLTDENLSQVLKVLADGGIVAFPTETYYGLAVDPYNGQALLKLFSVKQRSKKKPILVLIENIEQLSKLTGSIPEQYHPLMQQYWPGPLTLIFEAKKTVDKLLTGASGTVGVRISSHPLAKKLCAAWQNPITATSANLSGMSPAQTSEEVIHYFGDQIDCVIDGGETVGGLCSTIIGMEHNELKLIRKGQVVV